jgi:hypothetical protein
MAVRIIETNGPGVPAIKILLLDLFDIADGRIPSVFTPGVDLDAALLGNGNYRFENIEVTVIGALVPGSPCSCNTAGGGVA